MLKIILIFFLLLAPLSYSWNWNTHKYFPETIYYSTNMKENFNLTLLQEGAIAPDKDFHDTRNHHYPPTLILAKKYLKTTKEAIEDKDYNNASYSYGVFTHYISDSFAAPHNVEKEDSKLHSQFEKTTFNLKSKCQDYNYSLNDLRVSKKGKEDWSLWLETFNDEIIKEEQEESLKFIYSITLNEFNFTCLRGNTEIKSQYIIITPEIIIFFISSITLVSIYLFNKK